MLSRREFEAREERELAPYAAKSAQSRGRAHAEPEHAYRTAYQRDRDRLTHTLEVAQIARTLARALNLNEDLTEAVALAHDLGHTPFGHSGEEALRELMRDHGGFEHNHHGLRIVDKLEHPYPQFRGLNLTYEVRECIDKHATSYDKPHSTQFDAGNPPLEGQVVEMADAIAYDSHDLDDAIAMGVVSPTELHDLAIFRQAASDFATTLADLTEDQRIRRIAKLLIDLMVTDTIGTSERAIREAGVTNVDAVRAAPVRLVRLSEGLQPKVKQLEVFLMERVYRHYRVARMMTKSKRFITKIYEAYQANCDQLPPTYYERAKQEGLEIAICDYIAGMTDRYAQDEYQRLYEPFERV